MASTLREWKDSKPCADKACIPIPPLFSFHRSSRLFCDRFSHRSVSRFTALALLFGIAEMICVVTSDGRIILGLLVGHDQVQNLVLSDAVERVYAENVAVDVVDLGLYVVRGDNVAIISEYDAELWNDEMTAAPLPPILQQRN